MQGSAKWREATQDEPEDVEDNTSRWKRPNTENINRFSKDMNGKQGEDEYNMWVSKYEKPGDINMLPDHIRRGKAVLSEYEWKAHEARGQEE